MEIGALIRDIPDFPKPGILFRDITPLLADAEGLAAVVDQLEQWARSRAPDVIVGIESRGFIFGVPLALRLGVGFVPVRKPGKLPAETVRETYQLEYGTDSLEIHADALAPGRRVLIVDDLLATGGTAAATARLVRRVGGQVQGLLFVIELAALKGRRRLEGEAVHALLRYD
ncbi:MAG: adenine phosphoribosyltransferase [Acidobacteriota bacterium]|nr:adenine phosphoribosyltransferase [Acidobacteriota bacterium]MDQ7086855.1 adenine phosphoribosyltransferase [Acidobacteriota bacterium]